MVQTAECIDHVDLNQKNAGYWDPHMNKVLIKWLHTRDDYDKGCLDNALKELDYKTGSISNFPLLEMSSIEAKTERTKKMRAEFFVIEKKIANVLTCLRGIMNFCKEPGSEKIEIKSIKDWCVSLNIKEPDIAQENDNELCENNKLVQDNTLGENPLDLFLRYCEHFYAAGEYEVLKRLFLFHLDYACEYTYEGRDRIDLKMASLWGVIACYLVSMDFPESPEMVVKPEDADTWKKKNDQRGKDRNENLHIVCRYFLMLDEILSVIQKPMRQILLYQSWMYSWAMWPLMRYYFPKILQVTYTSGNPKEIVPNHLEWTKLLEWIFSDRSLCLISSLTPHLLRYIAVMAVLNRQRLDHFKAAVDVIAKYSARHSDLFTSILNSLFVKFNFEEAQHMLALCDKEAESDFLLAPLKDSITENTRLLIFQTYCRIQKAINIDMIAQKLHMTSETAERWIVNLIRYARLEAKIDSGKNRVEMASPIFSVHQQVLEKTREILIRTNVLIQNLDKTGMTGYQTSHAKENMNRRILPRMGDYASRLRS